MLFGDDISNKFISKWPTYYKPRIIANCKTLRFGAHVDDVLFGQQESDYGKSSWILECFVLVLGLNISSWVGVLYSISLGWDSDVAAVLMLVQLLPPTVKTRKTGKVSTAEASDRVVKFMKVCPKVLVRFKLICLASIVVCKDLYCLFPCCYMHVQKCMRFTHCY